MRSVQRGRLFGQLLVGAAENAPRRSTP